MEWFINFFSINNILVNVLGYSLSYLEAMGIITTLACIIYAARGKVTTFYFGLISTTLYFVFFYQAHLYSSMALQVVFFSFNVYGYLQWTRPKKGEEDERNELKISRYPVSKYLITVITIVVGTALWGFFMSNPPEILAKEFAEAKYPYIDAFILVASIAAQYLLSKKKLENWMIWITVDVVATGLYAASGATFTAILYAVLVGIASKGLYDWRKVYKSYNDAEIDEPIAVKATK